MYEVPYVHMVYPGFISYSATGYSSEISSTNYAGISHLSVTNPANSEIPSAAISSSIDIRKGADPSGHAFDSLALLPAETDRSHLLDEVMKFEDVNLNKIGTSNFYSIASNRSYQLPIDIFFLPPSVQRSHWPQANVISYCSSTDLSCQFCHIFNCTPRQLQFYCTDKRSPAFHVNLMI